MQQHGSKYFDCRPALLPMTLWFGSVGQNSTFSEHGYVAYQIKGNHECSNMVTNILIADRVNLRVGEMGFMFCDL